MTGGCNMKYGINTIGKNAQIFEPVTIGFPSRDKIGKPWGGDFAGTTIGNNAIIRSGTIIYCNVTIGDNFQTGHNVMIRENTRIGNNVSIGTATIIEGHTLIGDNVNLQSTVYIPTGTIIGNHVFISGSGDKRGHGKTPLFMAGMKCLPLCKVPLLSAANNYVESQNEPRVKK